MGISTGCGGVSAIASEKVCDPVARGTTSSGVGVSTKGSVPATKGSAAAAGSYTGCGCDSSKELSSARALSKATSRSHVRLKSSDAFRNSARPLPIDLASCGSFRGPKNMSATTRMKSNSVLPRLSRMSAKNTVVYLPVRLLRCKPRRSGMPGRVGLVG